MDRKLIRILLAVSLFLVITVATPLGNPVTWSDETRLTTHLNWDFGPSIVQMNDSRIWVVWESKRMGNWDIFYTIYNSSLWSDPMPLTTNPTRDITASLMQTNDGTIWLFWSSNRTGNPELFYKTSSDNGATWSNATQLTENPGHDFAPSIIRATNGTIWVVWESGGNGGFDLFYKTSSDNGATWSNATQLTWNIYNDEYPSIAEMRDGKVWVAWQRVTIDYIAIFYKTSSDGGASWSNETQLSELADHDYADIAPSIIQARDGVIWIFWGSDRILVWDPEGDEFVPQYEIFYKTSADNGATWSEDVQFTNSTWHEDHPSAAQFSDKRIGITWQSNKDDNFDIYYKNSSEIIFHDVAITNVTSFSTLAYQGNPINISVQAKNQGDFNETFNVTLYANSTAISTQTVTDLPLNTSTTLTFTWNTTSFAGNYTVSATAEPVLNETYTVDNTLVDGTVRIKIPGDIDGDDDVDSFDFYLFSGVYGTSEGHPYYNPQCDFDGDGNVDSFDFYLFSANYGKSI